MEINFDDISEVGLALKNEENKLLKVKIKIEQLKKVIKAHEEGIYNPKLFEDLIKRSKSI